MGVVRSWLLRLKADLLVLCHAAAGDMKVTGGATLGDSQSFFSARPKA